MASPMREKRVWPPQRDADGESVAAFEAAVAVVKETVVRSGEVLVSAKEDLNDHQRWLKAQTEAVLADRERHDRWLQRQRERQEVLERREQKRARRRAARQAAVQAVGDAIGRVLFAIRSAIWSVIARIVAGFRYLGASIGGAFGSVFAQLRRLVASFVAAVGNAFGFAGVAARAVSRSTSTSIAFGVSAAGAKVQHVAPSAGGGLSGAFGGVAARAKDASRGVRRSLGGAFAWLSVQADAITHKIGETLAPAGRTIAGKAYALMPALWDGLAKSGLAAKAVIDRGTARLHGFLPSAKAPAATSENALSWRGLRGFELSQMLIIAGALLLVVGGLMLGGGLMLRAGTPASPVAEAPPGEAIAWLFEHKTFPLDERSIFMSNLTPEGVRIKGFSIGAVNMEDEPVEHLEGVIKPDYHGEELKLDVIVVRPGLDGEAAPAAETPVAGPAETIANEPAAETVAEDQAAETAVDAAAETQSGTIPPQAPFKLVFLFPGAEGTSGMTPADVVKESGGILLKVRYEIAGKQRSFIQYLPASFLEEQLSELQAEAKGS